MKNLFIRTIDRSDSLQRFFFPVQLFFIRLQSIKFTVYSPEEIPLIVKSNRPFKERVNGQW